MPRTEDRPQSPEDTDAAVAADLDADLAADLDAARRRRRQEALDALAQAAELRARLRPRSFALARSRELLHNRTTRG